jgi:hypothetical protein
MRRTLIVLVAVLVVGPAVAGGVVTAEQSTVDSTAGVAAQAECGFPPEIS